MRDLRPVIDAYASLDLEDQMLALCDEAIARSTSPQEAAHARCIRGIQLLYAYDPAGIDEMYAAVDANPRYAMNGLDEIGAFCVQMGLSSELQKYRVRQVEAMQEYNDNYAGEADLSSIDRLSEDDALDPARGMENLRFIREAVGNDLCAVYQLKKRMSGDHCVTVYLLEFQDEVEDELRERYTDQVFGYLSTLPDWWHYVVLESRLSYRRIYRKFPQAKVYSR